MVPIADNLPQLRDIHLPDGISLWPVAYGWWIMLSALIALILMIYGWKYIRRKSKKLYALRQLKKMEKNPDIDVAVATSELLRRVCIYKYPQAVGIIGKEWIDFLHSHSKAKLDKNCMQLLLDAPYMPKATTEFRAGEIQKLLEFCKHWIGENL